MDTKNTKNQGEGIDDNELSEDVILEDPDLNIEDEDSSVENVTEIPIEEFMKDPEKMAKLSDEVDAEETTQWCPQCSDYTIFVDRVCTECGFTKSLKNTKDSEDEEESKGFQLTPDEDMGLVEDLGYGYYSEDEDPDNYE